MPAIGATLREARMRARIDISEIESETKIRAKYLRALENEEWDLLPGPTYVKSFLRTYAEALGLDARLLLEEYKLRHERLSDIELQPIAPPGRGDTAPQATGAAAGSRARTSIWFVVLARARGRLRARQELRGQRARHEPARAVAESVQHDAGQVQAQAQARRRAFARSAADLRHGARLRVPEGAPATARSSTARR